jgi:CRISPR-associated protein Cas5/DevS
MLLSLGGVDWQFRKNYKGNLLALATQGEYECSRVFRKFRRMPQSNAKADPLASRRPDYQDILTGLKLWVWLRDRGSANSLTDLVRMALDPDRRGQVNRYGGLSLGESSHLINDICIREPSGEGRFLCRDKNGYYQFPIWVSHPRSGDSQSRIGRFSILEPETLAEPADGDLRWISIDEYSEE